MITVEEIQEIKEKAEQKRRLLERAKGNREQLLKDLEKKFGCKTVEEAQNKLEELKEKGTALAAKIEKLKTRVLECWEEVESRG